MLTEGILAVRKVLGDHVSSVDGLSEVELLLSVIEKQGSTGALRARLDALVYDLQFRAELAGDAREAFVLDTVKEQLVGLGNILRHVKRRKVVQQPVQLTDQQVLMQAAQRRKFLKAFHDTLLQRVVSVCNTVVNNNKSQVNLITDDWQGTKENFVNMLEARQKRHVERDAIIKDKETVKQFYFSEVDKMLEAYVPIVKGHEVTNEEKETFLYWVSEVEKILVGDDPKKKGKNEDIEAIRGLFRQLERREGKQQDERIVQPEVPAEVEEEKVEDVGTKVESVEGDAMSTPPAVKEEEVEEVLIVEKGICSEFARQVDEGEKSKFITLMEAAVSELHEGDPRTVVTTSTFDGQDLQMDFALRQGDQEKTVKRILEDPDPILQAAVTFWLDKLQIMVTNAPETGEVYSEEDLEICRALGKKTVIALKAGTERERQIALFSLEEEFRRYFKVLCHWHMKTQFVGDVTIDLNLSSSGGVFVVDGQLFEMIGLAAHYQYDVPLSEPYSLSLTYNPEDLGYSFSSKEEPMRLKLPVDTPRKDNFIRYVTLECASWYLTEEQLVKHFIQETNQRFFIPVVKDRWFQHGRRPGNETTVDGYRFPCERDYPGNQVARIRFDRLAKIVGLLARIESSDEAFKIYALWVSEKYITKENGQVLGEDWDNNWFGESYYGPGGITKGCVLAAYMLLSDLATTPVTEINEALIRERLYTYGERMKYAKKYVNVAVRSLKGGFEELFTERQVFRTNMYFSTAMLLAVKRYPMGCEIPPSSTAEECAKADTKLLLGRIREIFNRLGLSTSKDNKVEFMKDFIREFIEGNGIGSDDVSEKLVVPFHRDFQWFFLNCFKERAATLSEASFEGYSARRLVIDIMLELAFYHVSEPSFVHYFTHSDNPSLEGWSQRIIEVIEEDIKQIQSFFDVFSDPPDNHDHIQQRYYGKETKKMPDNFFARTHFYFCVLSTRPQTELAPIGPIVLWEQFYPMVYSRILAMEHLHRDLYKETLGKAVPVYALEPYLVGAGRFDEGVYDFCVDDKRIKTPEFRKALLDESRALSLFDPRAKECLPIISMARVLEGCYEVVSTDVPPYRKAYYITAKWLKLSRGVRQAPVDMISSYFEGVYAGFKEGCKDSPILLVRGDSKGINNPAELCMWFAANYLYEQMYETRYKSHSSKYKKVAGIDAAFALVNKIKGEVGKDLELLGEQDGYTLASLFSSLQIVWRDSIDVLAQPEAWYEIVGRKYFRRGAYEGNAHLGRLVIPETIENKRREGVNVSETPLVAGTVARTIDYCAQYPTEGVLWYRKAYYYTLGDNSSGRSNNNDSREKLRDVYYSGFYKTFSVALNKSQKVNVVEDASGFETPQELCLWFAAKRISDTLIDQCVECGLKKGKKDKDYAKKYVEKHIEQLGEKEGERFFTFIRRVQIERNEENMLAVSKPVMERLVTDNVPQKTFGSESEYKELKFPSRFRVLQLDNCKKANNDLSGRML